MEGYLHAQNMRVNIAQITLIFFSSNFFTRDSTTSDNRACPSRSVSQTVHCNSGRAKKSERFGSGRRKEGGLGRVA